MSEKRVKAWHFTGDKLRDGSPIPKVGEWLEYPGNIVICNSGLHASRDPFDALRYAPGPILHLVECEWIVTEQHDKLVCARRRIIASKDATEGLRYFARMQALSVVHLWTAPDICIEWLMTGDDVVRAAAWDAAGAAAVAAARAAARAAAVDAARAAAGAAAVDAASAAAWAAAGAAAGVAARAAAGAAARAAAWDAAWDAAGDAARQQFNALVNEAFEEYL